MRAVLLAAVLFAVAACAQLETTVPHDVVFDLTGRLAARYGNQAFSGNIAWRYAGGSDELLITSPLGAGVARIVRDGNSVTLSTAEPKEYRGTDPEALTEEVLGFRVPVTGLADWVRGRPSGQGDAKAQYDAAGRLQTLEQAGWKVEYLEYDGQMPSRLRLTYPGIELRLAISQWK